MGPEPIHQDNVEDSWSHAQAAHKLPGQKYGLWRDIISGDTGIVVSTGCWCQQGQWADQYTYIMLTRHIIAIIVVVNQTFLHFGVKQCADVSKRGPQLCADQRTQTHAPESDMNVFTKPSVISIQPLIWEYNKVHALHIQYGAISLHSAQEYRITGCGTRYITVQGSQVDTYWWNVAHFTQMPNKMWIYGG